MRILLIVLRVCSALLASVDLLGYAWFYSESRGILLNIFGAVPFVALLGGATLPDRAFRPMVIRIIYVCVVAIAIVRYGLALAQDFSIEGGPSFLGIGMHTLVLIVLLGLLLRAKPREAIETGKA